MKSVLLGILLFLPIFLLSQVPQGLSYQAIAWDKNNLPKANVTITVTCNIIMLKPDGEIEFTEIQTAKTNELGYFTLIIGEKQTEQFKKINWGNGPKFLGVIIDGIATGTTQMLSVPYAMYAENANIKAGTGISVSGNTISNTGDADNDAGNEIQELQLTGNTLELSKSGGSADLSKLVTISRYKEAIFKVDFDPTFLSDIKNTTITVPVAGTYMIYATAEFYIPDAATTPYAELRISSDNGPAGGVVVDSNNDTGNFYLNGFHLFIMKANENVSLQFSGVYSNNTNKGYYRKATILAQKIN